MAFSFSLLDLGGKSFPLLIEPYTPTPFDETLFLIHQHKKLLSEKITQHGAILLRNFPIKSTREKRAILQALDIKIESSYPFGISPRSSLEEGIFKSTEIPNHFPLFAHTEMSYLPMRPKVIAFYCAIEPQIYGETPLFDMRALFRSLSEDTKTLLRSKQMHYVHYYPKSGPRFLKNVSLTWPSIFKTDDKDKVSEELKAQGFEYQWGKKDDLEYHTKVSGIIRHPITLDECINLLLLHPYVIRSVFAQIRKRQNIFFHYSVLLATLLFGKLKKPATSMYFVDKENIPFSIVKEICDLTFQHMSIFNWKQNDLLIVDNISIAHARMNVKNPRKITVSLGDMYQALAL